MKLQNLVPRIVGSLFVASAFVPLASYHFEGEPYIFGFLWNLMLPTGWLAVTAGAVMLLHQRIGLSKKQLVYVMLASGLLLMLLFRLQDVDYFLGLWHGVQGNFDTEKMTLTLAAFLVGIMGILGSLFLVTSSTTPPKHPSKLS